MTTLRLLHPPYGIFRGSRTPPGLYARQKWLGEETTARWQTDFKAKVADLYRDQSADGLWHGSALETIHRLFGLHLTVRNADARIHAALDRLLAMAAGPGSEAADERIGADGLAGLPFAPGPMPSVLATAAAFLAAIFGREADPAVLDLYGQLASDDREAAAWEDPALLHNRLRALVVHPRFAAHPATGAAVERLARWQTPRGDWGAKIPFFQALNALAHLAHPAAEDQCRKAFALLAETQNPDGSWGQDQPEWCTFLAIHALRNKGAIRMDAAAGPSGQPWDAAPR